MSPRPLAERIVAELALRGQRVVVAESLGTLAPLKVQKDSAQA